MVNEKLRDPLNDQLCDAMLTLRTREECYAFFEDICTISELKAMSQRLEVARMLRAKHTYDDIVAQTGASTATISRVKRCLNYGADGYTTVLARLDAVGEPIATKRRDAH
ncbi:MAG: YerC/YecD family TrpR-related protein [Selenomonadaceae bacterium]|nr:YerC/YecD family TrpR-related protein [Selenomonadaceae bacterium]